MFGFRYHKAVPTAYVMQFRNGQAVKEGTGLSFLYFAPLSTIVSIPVGSTDLPFIFTETTADFQAVTVQGQLTYRIEKPAQLAALMDFSVGPGGQYVSEDPDKLSERLVGIVQELTRDVIRRTPLKEALTIGGRVATGVLDGLRASPSIAMCGLEILGLAVTSIQPTAEMARALEAEMREELQRDADRAIYVRRNAAVEEERKIRENELKTEIAVEEKKKEIRETQMQAEIAVEERRRTLIEKRAENERREADTRAYALDAVLKPVRDVDWKTLMAVAPGVVDPKLMIALAFREMAENAQKIGELNISPDLLSQLIGTGHGKKG